MPYDADTDASTVSRRRVLKTTDARRWWRPVLFTGASTERICLRRIGGEQSDTSGTRPSAVETSRGRDTWFGLGAGIDSFDPSYSTSAPAGNVHGLVYDGSSRRTLRGPCPVARADVGTGRGPRGRRRSLRAVHGVGGDGRRGTSSPTTRSSSGTLTTARCDGQQTPDAVVDGNYGIQTKPNSTRASPSTTARK